MTLHELKTHPGSFQESWLRLKPFEVRKDDRGFEIGDTLLLREFFDESFTGRSIIGITITSKLVGGQYGIESGYSVLGLSFHGSANRGARSGVIEQFNKIGSEGTEE